jgi:deoxyribose-phosphate aldolase
MYTREQIAATIDHAVLKPTATERDVIEACRLGDKYHVAGVCVRPADVLLAAAKLKGSNVAVSTVVGFPHGGNRPEVKAFETRLAVEDGAAEIDMVMNVGKFLSGDYSFVQKDIEAVVMEAKKHNVLVKVILEICYLSREQIEQACKIAEAAGADFVKTSTGFGDYGATAEAVEIMVKTVGRNMGVKASGGVKSYDVAVGYLRQGCRRLGTSSTESILMEAPE